MKKLNFLKFIKNNEKPFYLPSKYRKYLVSKNKNWNQSSEKNSDDYLAKYICVYLPYILATKRRFTNNLDPIKILDFGCGWGPLAVALKLYRDANNKELSYLGLDIMKDSISFLKREFQNDKNFSFHHINASDETNYVKQARLKKKTTPNSYGKEAKFSDEIDQLFNLQWSSSVFTHLSSDAAQIGLQSISKISQNDCIHVNTWLIVDDMSTYGLLTKQCDRELPYDFGDFLTYSKENPLVCTAFKINKILEFYEKANLEILDIERGSWRGKYFKNPASHYQDIIISRPKRS